MSAACFQTRLCCRRVLIVEQVLYRVVHDGEQRQKQIMKDAREIDGICIFSRVVKSRHVLQMSQAPINQL